MGRGLGKMQTAILDALDTTKETCVDYKGSVSIEYFPLPYCLPGWVMYRRASVWLAENVYDLRAVSKLLSDNLGYKMYDRHKFQPSFSRSVLLLIQRGKLIKPSLVPIKDIERDPYRVVEHLRDGDYIHAGRETRFVVRAST